MAERGLHLRGRCAGIRRELREQAPEIVHAELRSADRSRRGLEVVPEPAIASRTRRCGTGESAGGCEARHREEAKAPALNALPVYSTPFTQSYRARIAA